ncbi:MAG TPA: dihydrofolate reductase family protein [Actinomycetota bacterium]|nr:dihydrofolate reductase family protein [Actinomycetes bacterium]HEX5880626.1 dihydrofolate reductase family protein [Actinomycetota bacterium]
MREITVFNSVTLDGVTQAPGRPDEDTRGGFANGGWAAPYMDEVMGRVAAEGMAGPGALLLGRRTYEDFHGFWPHQTDNPFTEVLDNTRKYVASRTLREPLPWRNSTLLEGDAAEAVARLKEQPGEDLTVLGSGELVQSLRRRDLVDRYVLLIHPLVLGSGRRLFPDGGPASTLRLVGSVPTTTGVIIATYQPVTSREGAAR